FSALTGRASWKANDEPTVPETMAAQNTAEIQRARIEGEKIDCAIISLQFLSSGVTGVSYSKHGTGVTGAAVSETGKTVGVRGASKSPDGIGVQGVADSTTGEAIGVRGDSKSGAGALLQRSRGGSVGGGSRSRVASSRAWRISIFNLQSSILYPLSSILYPRSSLRSATSFPFTNTPTGCSIPAK